MQGSQKTKRLRLFLLLMLLLLLGGVYLYLFGGPYRFVEVALREKSLEHLRSNVAVSSPEDAALEYLHASVNPSDRPKRDRLDITTRHSSGQEAVVTIINRFCQDDSLYVSCDRLTLRQEAGVWLPVLHQACWQGRGRVGWTTKPTL